MLSINLHYNIEHMILKRVIFILAIFIGINSHAMAAPPLQRVLIVKGQILNEKQEPIPFAEIESTFIPETYFDAFPVIKSLKADSLGAYQFRIESYGDYKFSFRSKGKVTYSLSADFSKSQALIMATREYILDHNVVLKPASKHSKPDIYNGDDLQFESRKVYTKPYKRYIQLSDRKLKKGFKTPEKLSKFVYKCVKKEKIEKLVPRMATRADIDTIIENKVHPEEVRKKWSRNFGQKATDINYDKRRIEQVQISYWKVVQRDAEDELINQFKNYQIDNKKTLQQDDTKKVFNTYRYNFINRQNVPMAFDLIMINTLTGWKVFIIYEVA